MRRVAVVVALVALMLVASAAPASSADCAARQGVVQVHQQAGGTHWQPSGVAADGALVNLDLHGHTGSPPLVSAWQTCGTGAWAVTPEGHVYIGGDAGHFGDTKAIALNQPIVGMAPTPTGQGYWLVARDGGIFAFGDARFLGSTGAITLNQPIVAMASTPTGRGYWLAAADGGIFAFGDARFFGSTGAITLNRPVVGMVATPTGLGYWLVGADGGIFTFGDATFKGSTASSGATTPVVGMIPNDEGYTIVDREGTITAFPSGASTGGGHDDHGDDGEVPLGTGPIISLDDPRVTAAQHAAAVALIDRTAIGMQAFPDEQSLIDAGYTSIGDGATGYEHYVSWLLLIDGKELDETAIESVVLRVEDGVKTVASAMYILSLGDGMDDVPDVAGELTTWHDHTDLCFEIPRVVGLAVDGHCERGTLIATPPMLHVWTTEHPCGPFAGIETGGHGSSCHGGDDH